MSSIGSNISHDLVSRRSAGNVLALKVAEEAGVAGAEGAGATKGVDDTVTAEVGLAFFARGGGGDGEELAAVAAFDDLIDVLEDVALGENICAIGKLEGVPGVLVPVVVDLVMNVSVLNWRMRRWWREKLTA